MGNIDTKEAKKEIEQARGYNSAKACLMSFARRNVKAFRKMAPAERKDVLKQLGLNPASHYKVISDEIALFNYEQIRKITK